MKSEQQVEYKEVHLMYPKGREQIWHRTHYTIGAARKAEEHNNEASARMRAWVDQEAGPYLREGWILDGPFDVAVRSDWEDKDSFWATWREGKRWFRGAWVRFRRYVR